MKTFTAKEARHAMLDEPGREMVRVVANRHIDTFRFSGTRFELLEKEAWVEFYPGRFTEFGDGYLTAYHWLDEWEAEKAASKAANVRLSRETRERITMDDVVIYETFLVYDVIPAIRREMEKK